MNFERSSPNWLCSAPRFTRRIQSQTKSPESLREKSSASFFLISATTSGEDNVVACVCQTQFRFLDVLPAPSAAIAVKSTGWRLLFPVARDRRAEFRGYKRDAKRVTGGYGRLLFLRCPGHPNFLSVSAHPYFDQEGKRGKVRANAYFRPK